jgi:hypothetical protein
VHPGVPAAVTDDLKRNHSHTHLQVAQLYQELMYNDKCSMLHVGWAVDILTNAEKLREQDWHDLRGGLTPTSSHNM